jgi:hypothetical protein
MASRATSIPGDDRWEVWLVELAIMNVGVTRTALS